MFRELEEEYSRSIHRNIGFSGDYGFDGLLVRGRRFTAFEVKFTRQGHWRTGILRKVFPTFKRLADEFPKYSDFVLVIVYEGLDEDEVAKNRAEAREYLNKCEVRIKLKLFDFDHLRAKYGLVEAGAEHQDAKDG